MKHISVIMASVTLLGLVGIYYLHFSGKPKVGFVRSNELVYGYEGMKDAQFLQESKSREYKSNFDTLQSDFQKALSQYNLGLSGFSKEEKQEKERMLAMQQQNLKKYSESIQQSISESDQSLTQGILTQINSFVEEYAKKHGYSLIFGTTTSGNILYGEPAMDVTQDVLKQLNENYKNLPDSLSHGR